MVGQVYSRLAQFEGLDNAPSMAIRSVADVRVRFTPPTPVLFRDDFNGTSLNTSNWSVGSGRSAARAGSAPPRPPTGWPR